MIVRNGLGNKMTVSVLLFRAALCILFLTLLPFNVLALNSYIGVKAGYDDNVEQTETSSGSAYSATYVNISKQKLHKALFGESKLYIDASYRKYFDFNDEINFSVGGQYSFLPFGDALVTKGFIEAGIFRESENSPDEYNWGKTGIQLQYKYSDKVRFDASQSVKVYDYLTPVESLTEITQGQGGGSPVTTEIIIAEEQNDLLLSTDVGIQLELDSSFDIDMAALFTRLYSSIDNEEYEETGGIVVLNYSPEKSWLFTVKQSRFYKDFLVYTPRSDTFDSSGLIISKMTDRFDVFLGIDFMRNKSTMSYESYRQRVTQCGLTYYF